MLSSSCACILSSQWHEAKEMFVFYKAAEGQKISQKYIGTFIIGAFKHMQYVPEIVIAFDQVQDVYMCIFKDLTQLNTG